MHIILYSKIASEKNFFDIGDVIEKVTDKIIFRHPHVFGNITVDNSDDVKKIWEISKLKEQNENFKSVLNGVPKSLPSLIKAFRIQEKAAGVGFEWKSKDDVWLKVEEELEEFKREVRQDIKDEYILLREKFNERTAKKLYELCRKNILISSWFL